MIFKRKTPSGDHPVRDRQTKILATVGPASSDPEMLEKLFLRGVDCFRLNFSHGTHDDHKQRVKDIRKLEKKFGSPIGIVADMQGPKLRLGKFKDGKIEVKQGDQIRFDLDAAPGDNQRIGIPHHEIIEALDVDQMFLIDDGKVRVQVIEKGSDYVIGEIVAGSKLSDRKGVNVPGVVLNIAALTEKDHKDLKFALSQDVDWVALSFVQRASDIQEAREIIGDRAAIMAKIEKPSAVENFEAILNEADGIMLARGDLGVEIPPEDVPAVQKRLSKKVRQSGKPLVIATQMLESMITSPTPTRAEASDVANAVYDGADAVMLSAETAAGDYPIEAVEIMNRIARATEKDPSYRTIINSGDLIEHETDAGAITASATSVAEIIGSRIIVNYTSSGSTALRTARERPAQRILCLTANINVARRLALSYAVKPVVSNDISRFADIVRTATTVAQNYEMVADGDSMVITAGVPFGVSGTTNILRIARI